MDLGWKCLSVGKFPTDILWLTKVFYSNCIKEVQPIITSNHSNYNMRFKNGFALIPASINEMTSTLPLEKKCALSRRLI